MTVTEGDSLPGPMKMEGNCHLHCRMHPPVRELDGKALQGGVSQHRAVIPGRRAGELREVCF